MSTVEQIKTAQDSLVESFTRSMAGLALLNLVTFVMKTRYRRNTLIFSGVPEAKNDDYRTAMLKIVHNMEVPNVSIFNVNVCRLGALWFNSQL